MNKRNLPIHRVLLMAFLMLGSLWGFGQATFTSIASGPWTTTTTWSKTGTSTQNFPQAGDIVTIQNDHDVTLTANAAAANVTMLGPSANGITTLIVGSSTLTLTGNLAINGGNTNNRKTTVTISTGTINIEGNLSNQNGISAELTFTGAGTINMTGGISIWSFAGTLTPSTSTVNFSGANASITTASTFNNLTIQTGAGVTATALIKTNGAFTLAGTAKYIHNAPGTTTGAVSDFPGVSPGSTNFSATSTVEFQKWSNGTANFPVALPALTWGNLIVNITTLGGNINMAGTLTSVLGSLSILATGGITREFQLSGNTTYTLAIGGDLNISGGILNLSNGIGTLASPMDIEIGGNYNQTGGTFTQTATNHISKISFKGGASNNVTFVQSAGTLTGTRMNWSIVAAKTVTLSNTFTLASGRNITIDGTLAASAAYTINGTLRLNQGGAVTGLAAAYSAGGILEYAGTSTQTVTAIEWPTTSGPATVVINNAAGVSLSTNRSVSNLSLTTGIFTSSAILTVTNTATTAVSGGSTTAYVSGSLSRTLPASFSTIPTNYDFPIGKRGVYLPFQLNNPKTGSTSPVIQVEAFNTGSGGTGDGTTTSAVSTSEYWLASVVSASLLDTRVSLTRQSTLGNLNTIGISTTQTGAYASLGGSVNSPSINFSNVTGNLGYFSLAQLISTTDFKSAGAVNLTAATNWLYFNGTSDVSASVPPVGTNNITILNNDSLTVNANLDMASGKTLLVSSGRVGISPNFNLSAAGTLNFNSQRITVKSDPTGTGIIGQITGTLSGASNVMVERYIPATSFRAYRSLAPSVTTTTSIKTNWQEGSSNPDQTTNVDGLAGPGFGTHISGTSADAGLGFDPTLNGHRSLFTYSTSGYTAVLNTTTNTLDATTGYLLFVRGDRSNISRLNANSSGNTTLRATGTLLTGNQSYTLNGNSLFTLVTNPYAAPINWSTIFGDASTTNLANFYTYVDPRVGSQGGYVTVTNGGTNSTPTTNATVNIQSGQAFFVKASIATVPTITIKETHKSTINNINVYRTGSQEQMSIGLYFALNGGKRVADGVNILFNNNYSANVDGDDAEQIANFDEDISIKREGKFLSIEGRPLVDQADTIFLNMIHMKQKAYTLEFSPASFNAPGLMAYLQDKYLDNETQISLTDQTIVPFFIDAITASAASDRFRVVFRTITVLPINFTNVKAFEKGNNIQVEWNLGNESSLKLYEIEKSTDGRTFIKAGTQTKRSQLSTENYSWLDATPATGNNYYRIKAIEQNSPYKYSQVVNVKVGKGNSAITIYPNPVKGNVINLQMVNEPKGQYSIRLINAAGQQVYRKEFNHPGGSASETLSIGTRLAKGVYTLAISTNDTTTNQKVFVE